MSNTDRSATKREGGGVPPLAWIIIAGLLLIVAAAWFTMDESRRGPSGGPAMPLDRPEAPAAVDPAPLPAPSATPAP